jgi:immunoglobulin-like protein involved in spore germination
MRFFRAVVYAALFAIVLATGCGQGSLEEQGTEATETSSPVSESQARQETTPENETAQAPAPGDEIADGEVTEAPFTAAPEMSGGSEGAADSIQEVRFGKHEGYERAVIGFGSGGAPASQVPAWSLSSPTGEGYARITFPNLDGTSETEGVLGGSILDNFYVVRAPGGGVFVDIFATGAFQYRVVELSDPGRLVVDYRPVSVSLDFPIPAQTERTVLFQPRAGEAIASPLRVSGYSRNFEGSNIIVLSDPGGNVLSRGTALSNDWAETWGYFETLLEFAPFEGEAILRVGSRSPRDGSFEGVEVPVGYAGGQG